MKLLLLLFMCLLSFSAHAAKPTSAQVKECVSYLKMPRSRQEKLARQTGYPLNMTVWACQSIIRMSHGGHATAPPGYHAPSSRDDDDHEPLWYGHSCDTTRECGPTENCINRMCKPAGYGGCNNTDSCPSGESCVAGSCQ